MTSGEWRMANGEWRLGLSGAEALAKGEWGRCLSVVEGWCLSVVEGRLFVLTIIH
jgi:hypothetical protein